MKSDLAIRAATEEDWPEIWRILQPIFRAGETYVYATDIAEGEARSIWLKAPRATFVASDGAGRVVGTYFLKANQPGLGDHVCNCGYAVDPAARGAGAASAMCAHSQDAARAMGFAHMQFNLVVATNEVAIRLWRRHGFAEVGTLPGAFRHARLGPVDALVMYKTL